MNKIDKCKAARDYHTHGCNCAQSILAAFHQEMGLTEDQCMALAGGMGQAPHYPAGPGVYSPLPGMLHGPRLRRPA